MRPRQYAAECIQPGEQSRILTAIQRLIDERQDGEAIAPPRDVHELDVFLYVRQSGGVFDGEASKGYVHALGLRFLMSQEYRRSSPVSVGKLQTCQIQFAVSNPFRPLRLQNVNKRPLLYHRRGITGAEAVQEAN